MSESPAVRRSPLDAFAESPFAGIAPWIVMSIISGPGRFEIAVLLALALSVSVFLIGRRRGGSIKLMEIFDLLFFAGFAVVGVLATPGMTSWLETWAGEIVNVALVVFVLITIALRQPFTLQYAKETTDRELWDNPVFLRINYTITWVWAAAFLWQSLMGAIDDGFDPGSDFWTGWILQIGAMVFAIAFTAYYPDYASAKAQGLDDVPSKVALIEWLPVFVIITGAAALLTDATATWVGIVCLVVGGVGELVLIRYQKTHDSEKTRSN